MMARERFRQTGQQSFFGRWVYDRIVPQDHFLMQLDGIIPWPRFAKKLVRYYQGKALYGPAPYNPVIIFKMLLLSFLYDISERQTEELVNFNLVAKCFVGLAVDEPAPDHSTLSLFKTRLLENKKTTAFEMLLQEIIAIAKEQGVAFGSLQVLDSVHVIADVNVPKDEGRQSKGQAPRDGDAAWGVKHTKKVRDQKGKVVKQKEYFYGFKEHVSLNVATGLITSVTHTAGNAYDGHQLPTLVQSDLAQGIPVTTVTADKAYDDGENHEFLWSHKMHSAIRLNDYRTAKKDDNKGIWIRLQQSPEYCAGLKERYTVERKFGEGKEQHGLRRCRYIGLPRFAVQGFLTVLAMNLKRLVVLIMGNETGHTMAAPIVA
jgi:transposase, IS5 family